jgi:hypothetical protein
MRNKMYRHWLEFVLIIFVALSVGASEQTSILTADTDIWFWENNPDVTMEDDLVNAWSTASGDRRYGVVEFDLSGLPPGPLTDVTLRLWAVSWMESQQIVQSAVAIDTTGGTPASALTWNVYQSEYAGTGAVLNSLGRVMFFPSGPGDVDRFVDSTADAADIAVVENLMQTSGLLTLVLIADEDGTDYRGDWADGLPLYGGMKAELVVNALIFADSFECGDCTEWSSTVGELP